MKSSVDIAGSTLAEYEGQRQYAHAIGTASELNVLVEEICWG